MTIIVGRTLGLDVVEQAAAGDQAAFARVVAAHHDDMVRVSYLVCGDVEIAHEAVAAAWAIAWRKLRTLREPERLRPWLTAIAANEARRLAGRQREHHHHVVELEMAEFDLDTGPGAQARSQAGADVLDLRDALRKLDPADRALLALRYVGGFNSTELGLATGMSASGTRARLARLLDRLRSELGDD